jgi:hypothetical protein
MSSLAGTDPSPAFAAPVAVPVVEDQIKTLKELVLGNCRLLYGSERMKFYGM